MSIEKRRNTYVLAKGTTWGTTPTFSTNSIIYAQSMSGFDGAVHAEEPDMGAGMGLVMSAAQGPDTPPTPSFSIWAYQNDYLSLFLLAAHYGNDTVTGAGDPYSHTCVYQEVSNYFYGMGQENGDEYFALPSAVSENIDLTFEGDTGVASFTVSAKGTTVSIATSAIVSIATAKTYASPFLLQNATLWINAQSGGALSSSDEIEVIEPKMSWPRPSDSVIASGNSYILQPVQGEMPVNTLTFKIPHKNAAAKTLYTAYKSGTLQKIQFNLAGTSANDSLTFYEPQARIIKCTHPQDDVISTEVEIRLEKAASAPTGMANTVSYFVWKTDISTSPLS